jgi:hypothetical protein
MLYDGLSKPMQLSLSVAATLQMYPQSLQLQDRMTPFIAINIITLASLMDVVYHMRVFTDSGITT